MKILTFNAYYIPEIASSMYLTEDVFEGLVASGHIVELYAPIPCRGLNSDDRKKYRKKKYEEKYNGGLKIHRFFLPYECQNVLLRAIRYLLLNAICLWKSLFADFDVLYVQSTPPTQGFMAAIIKKIKKKPFVYCLQDIFPDSMLNAGLIQQGSFLWKIGRKIEDFTYKNADEIILISKGFKSNIMNKGVQEEKITVIPNWIDLDKVRPVPKKENCIFSEYRINKESFIVTYAGNFGVAQGVDIIIDAAKLLLDYDDITFVLFGGGSDYERIKKRAFHDGCRNVIIERLLSPERVSEVYSLGDVGIVTCKAGFGKVGMPSKMLSMMACNLPIIACYDTDSDLADVLKDSKAGECVIPEKPQELAKKILEYKKRNIKYEQKSGRSYLVGHISKEVCVQNYVKTIERTINA